MAVRISLPWLAAGVGFSVLTVIGFGCARSSAPKSAGAPAVGESSAMARKEAAGAGREAQDAAPAKKAANGAGAADPVAVSAAPAAPMIIYTHTLDVIVKDLDVATPEVEKLVTAHKGYVAKSEVKSDTGARRTATYTLRLPVGADRAVKEALLALGTPERNAVETQDVGEEFVDVEKRIKNLRELEDKLNELLKEKRKEEKLEDVKGLMKEVAGVRSDIERAQGRREYLLNRTSYSTTYLTLREIKDYKPPTAPTFGTKIGDTFGRSWEAVVDFAEGFVLVLVALVPWAPLWVPAAVALGWAVRRLVRASREEAARDARERARSAGDAGDATVLEPLDPPDDPPRPD